MLSANLGVDTRLGEDLLAGVSLGRSRGSVDYTSPDASAGEFTTTVTSVTPYMGWQGSDGMSLWALAGHGWGEVEIEDAAGTQSSDMTQFVMAAGLSGTLVSSDELIEGGTTRLRMKGDAAFTEAEVDGSGTIEAVTLEAGRHRLTLEGSHTRRLESGATLTPSLEVGMRNDVGDGETGSGIEAGGGVRFADEATGITVEGRARTLLNHGGGSEEWGVSGLVRLDPGSAGRGLALSVQPAWGPTASGVERLWQTGVVPGASRESGRPGGAPGLRHGVAGRPRHGNAGDGAGALRGRPRLASWLDPGTCPDGAGVLVPLQPGGNAVGARTRRRNTGEPGRDHRFHALVGQRTGPGIGMVGTAGETGWPTHRQT